MPHVLVLNASYEPLGVVPLRRAVILVLNRKAVCIEESGAFIHTVSAAVPAPSVVRLTRFVRVPFRSGPIPLTRRALFARDGGRCVYCGSVATSIDHVVPRSRGGQHAWENVVASCRRCNHVKADRPLRELGWRMSRAPSQPSGPAWRIIGTGHRDPSWLPYLVPYGGADLLARTALNTGAPKPPDPLPTPA
ncbi:endonuclease [Mangrovactinospora gilvigrisea]|uniref:Endonuclease n=1 Tax=Mangrovactinospora gilvigrisea TaxID=1428644 RepID=A0A1J7C852_9ACTN|nr:HNH endonuclease [Mangrovactinospora gilvigrisea]OIV37704.1 endonuclease [Mangrovactinospora gilvigrisea]